MTKRLSAAAALLAAAWLLAGCERPFIEVSEPEIEIVEPDLSEVITVTQIQLEVRATSFRAVDRVLLQGEPMEFDRESGLWRRIVDLSTGVNELVITAFDVQDVAAHDTAVVVVLAPSVSANAPRLPIGVGDHASILTAGGALLVTGGATRPNGEALDVAFISSPAGAPFEELPSRMRRARLGHTMTNLPDGRVLIAGGSARGIVNEVLTLVEPGEIYDPSTGEFLFVTTAGDPIRRTHHTASGESGESGFVLDLFGGRGDTQYHPPLIGVRQDIRSFIFRNDSLISFTAAPGPFLGQPVAGHTQTKLVMTEEFEPTEFLIHGTHFGDGFMESVSFTVDFRDPLGLIVRETGRTQEPRTHHATVTLADGLVITLGGSRESRDAPLSSVELYVDRRREFLSVPFGQTRPLPRSGHTATKLPDGRIMIAGGFVTGGNSTTVSEYLLLSTN